MRAEQRCRLSDPFAIDCNFLKSAIGGDRPKRIRIAALCQRSSRNTADGMAGRIGHFRQWRILQLKKNTDVHCYSK
jgi:hypothetical protein